MDTHGKVKASNGSDDGGDTPVSRRWIVRVACALLMLAAIAYLGLRDVPDDADGEMPVDHSPAGQMLEAARHGDATAVMCALDEGVPVDVTDDVGQTALIFTIRRGNDPLVRMLIARGADVNHVCSATTPLMEAASYGEFDMTDQLLRAGANANLPTPLGLTPLMAAAMSDEAACVRLLLSHGADPCMVDHAGDTARAAAELWNHTAMADELRAAERAAGRRTAIRVADNAPRSAGAPAQAVP